MQETKEYSASSYSMDIKLTSFLRNLFLAGFLVVAPVLASDIVADAEPKKTTTTVTKQTPQEKVIAELIEQMGTKEVCGYDKATIERLKTIDKRLVGENVVIDPLMVSKFVKNSGHWKTLEEYRDIMDKAHKVLGISNRKTFITIGPESNFRNKNVNGHAHLSQGFFCLNESRFVLLNNATFMDDLKVSLHELAHLTNENRAIKDPNSKEEHADILALYIMNVLKDDKTLSKYRVEYQKYFQSRVANTKQFLNRKALHKSIHDVRQYGINSLLQMLGHDERTLTGFDQYLLRGTNNINDLVYHLADQVAGSQNRDKTLQRIPSFIALFNACLDAEKQTVAQR